MKCDGMRLVCVAVLTGAAACGLAEQPSSVPATRPAVQVGRETTYFTAPLLPDGRVDYLGALNQRFSQGVTAENNAAVVLLQTWDAQGDSIAPHNSVKDRSAALKALGHGDSPQRVVLRKYGGTASSSDKHSAQFVTAQKSPWQEKDCPDVAAWLKDNAQALDLIAQASHRTRYFMPVVRVASPPDAAIRELLPLYGVFSYFRESAKGLVMRANLALGEGRTGEAVEDLLAVKRLADLGGQDGTMIGQLAASGISGLATFTAAEWATTDMLDAASAGKLIEALANSPAMTMAPAIDVYERCLVLDALQQLWQLPEGKFEKALAGMAPQAQVNGAQAARVAVTVDPNVVLRQVNACYDEQVKAMEMADAAAQAKVFEALTLRQNQAKAEAKNVPETSALQGDRDRWACQGVIGYLVFGEGLAPSQMAAVRCNVHRDLTIVALALAAHKAQHGQYPQKLDELAPAYLKQVPLDWFSGKAFIYKPSKDGYLLCSVGTDMRDDDKDDWKTGHIVMQVPVVNTSR